jgi:predicted nucleic-acid-binding protein
MNEQAFADTNLFIRLFTRDDPVQTEAVVSLFQRAAKGELTLVTNVTVIAEIVWVLERKKAPSDTIRDHIWAILNTSGIVVDSADLVGQAIDVYANKNIDFVDAYNICWMRANKMTRVYTFDHKHFSRVEEIEVNAPQ